MKAIIILISLAILAQFKLYQVVSLTRHGARYHVNDFADGNQTRPLWGQLTSVGMRQHQRLGQIFRAQYVDTLKFLSPKYNSSEIQVYSTPFNRTMLSVQSQLYGLYPLKSGPKLTYVDKQWHLPPYSNKTDDQQQNFALPKGHQPIKIKLNSKVMLSDCPNYGKYQKINFQLNAEEVKQMNMTYTPFVKRMAPIFNYSANSASFYTMLRAWDAINVDNYLGRTVSANLSMQDQQNILHLANWYYLMTSLNNNSIMFSSGKLSKIINQFDMKIRLPNTYRLKWSFLGGHDTDIFSLYVALNLSSSLCIQQKYRKGNTSALNCQDGANHFAASLIFELHSDDEKSFYVKIRSNGRYVKLCGKNSTQCEYNEFKAFAKKSIVANIDDICGRKVGDNESENLPHNPQQTTQLSQQKQLTNIEQEIVYQIL